MSSKNNTILPVAVDGSGNLLFSGNIIANSSGSVIPSTITQAIAFSSTVTLNGTQSATNDAATIGYVNATAQGLEIKAACFAATTATLNASYLNGAAGVGATLLNTGSLAAFSVDGQSPAINSRILVKDQTSSFQNGIYTLTTVGSGAIAWILTRSTDYNTAPSEIAPGNLVPVDNGTVNATTSWLQTATVTTIGTDAITFTQFSASPNTFLKVASNLSDVNSGSTSFNNISGLTTLGDTLYGGASGTRTRLAGNTTATKNFLIQTGNGSVSAAPSWGTIAGSDLPNPSASTLGGVQSLAVVSSNWINTISTSGVPSATQPAFTDISGTATTGQVATTLTGKTLTTATLTSPTVNGAIVTAVSKTGTYSVLATDDVVFVDGTSAFTATVPAATGNLGKKFTFIRTDQTVANAVTIATGGGNIDGVSTTTLNTQYERLEIVSNGTNYFTSHRSYSQAWSSSVYTWVLTNFGTVASSTIISRRIGDSLEVIGTFTAGTPVASAATITMPTGLTISSTLPSNSWGTPLGIWVGGNVGGTTALFNVAGQTGVNFYDGSTNTTIYFGYQTTTSALVKNLGTIAGTAQPMSFHFTVPITGWKA